MSDRLKHLKELGFIGCLNDSLVNSTNYKEFLYGEKMHWIKTRDQIPKEDGEYLTRVMDNGCSIFYEVQRFYSEPRILKGVYGDCKTHWENTTWDDYIITHWMAILEPPKDD